MYAFLVVVALSLALSLFYLINPFQSSHYTNTTTVCAILYAAEFSTSTARLIVPVSSS